MGSVDWLRCGIMWVWWGAGGPWFGGLRLGSGYQCLCHRVLRFENAGFRFPGPLQGSTLCLLPALQTPFPGPEPGQIMSQCGKPETIDALNPKP